MDDKKLKQLYFSHDIYADKDEKIIKMSYYFRKNINEFSDDFLKRNFFHAAFGLFWEIVQYMHRNTLTVDEIPMLADELRADENFVKSIINDFNLFKIVDGKIISERILRNLQNTTEKSRTNSKSVQTRWLLSSFAKYYEEFFEEKPVLSSAEIMALKQYSEQIPDFKDKLRDILYTLKNLKFDTDVNFKPCANWLLKGNNLARLVNGEFGSLKHKKTEKELQEEERQKAEEEKAETSEFDKRVQSCSGKAEALDLIAEYYADKPLNTQRGRLLIPPPLRTYLTNKFDITDKEVTKHLEKKYG